MSENHKKHPTPKGTGAYQINKLTIGQQIKLAEWIKSHKHELQATRPRRTDVAIQAGKELGFLVTECSVRSIARATECQWTERMDRSNNKPPYASVKPQVACLKVQVQTLRESLIGLMEAAGHPIPASLQSEWPNCTPTE